MRLGRALRQDELGPTAAFMEHRPNRHQTEALTGESEREKLT